MSRGVRRFAIYIDDADYREFLRLLSIVKRRYGWHCLAYCLIVNHYHLVIETPEANLSLGMQWLNSRYAEYFNGRYGHAGHVFERRFRDVVVRDERHLAELFRYIVLNPVRAGLCRDGAQWPWSSLAEATGAVSPWLTSPERLLRSFGSSADARATLAAFVRADMAASAMTGV